MMIKDLEMSKELDRNALSAVRGGNDLIGQAALVDVDSSSEANGPLSTSLSLPVTTVNQIAVIASPTVTVDANGLTTSALGSIFD